MALPFLPAIDALQDDTLEELLAEKRRQLAFAKQSWRPTPPSPQLGRKEVKRERHHAKLDYLGSSTHRELPVAPRERSGDGSSERRNWLSLIRPKTSATRKLHDVAPCANGQMAEAFETDDAVSLFAALHLEMPDPRPEEDHDSCSPDTLRPRSSESSLVDWHSKRTRQTVTTDDTCMSFLNRPSPPSARDGNTASPPTRSSTRYSAAALPSTIDRIFPQRRKEGTVGNARILRNDLESAATRLDNCMWTFPATEIFRACARMLVTPFGDDFTLDPLQLNSPALFFLPTGFVPSPDRSAGQIRVLDLGGSEQDEYALHLAALPTVSLDKFVLHESPISKTSSSSSLSPPISDSAMDDESKERSKAVSGMTSLARLPHPNASVDVISARSLHKDVRVGGGLVDEPRERLRAWLEECHRVLVPGGRLEYIYFGDKLLCCGPLTGELEAVLWDVWAENSAGGDGQGPTTDDFIALMNQVGFTDRRHLTMRFGLFTLRSLFDHRGVRRRGKATALSVEQHQPGSRHPPVPGTVGPQDYIDQKAHELLFRVYEECASRETGWECVMGYSTKAC